ncbi:MAG: hypothetical protein K2P27_13945, partial [Lachnospiraceae bacterium]|nr:hypothetical protein [Lachnospiraceae bacterium]
MNIAEITATKSRNVGKNYEPICRIYEWVCELYTENILKTEQKPEGGNVPMSNENNGNHGITEIVNSGSCCYK